MAEVKVRRRGTSRISSKNQATIPVDALRAAGLHAGDEVRIEAAGAGRILLSRTDDVLARYAGALPGIFPKGYLRRIRAEWR
ncbi:MAG TPA: AbrB/MazE/SpoVT family DNA-binding domain-containing protein [Candidatus Limnocylindria bacterium]